MQTVPPRDFWWIEALVKAVASSYQLNTSSCLLYHPLTYYCISASRPPLGATKVRQRSNFGGRQMCLSPSPRSSIHLENSGPDTAQHITRDVRELGAGAKQRYQLLSLPPLRIIILYHRQISTAKACSGTFWRSRERTDPWPVKLESAGVL